MPRISVEEEAIAPSLRSRFLLHNYPRLHINRERGPLDSDDEDHPQHSMMEGGLDNYEALINLDDNVVRPVPRQLLALLPTTKFT